MAEEGMVQGVVVPSEQPNDVETKWKAEEEARQAAMGATADPWDDAKPANVSPNSL
jgi:hypothetical protein